MKRYLMILSAILIPVFFLLLSGTGLSEETPEKLNFFALDTAISLTGYGKEKEKVLSEIQDQILSMEKEFSRTLPESTVSTLNHSDGTAMSVSPSLFHLLTQAQTISGLTSGVFDLTIAPAADLWGFTKNNFSIPSRKELLSVKKVTGMKHLHLESGTVRLDPGSEIDLGGIAKGYALEQALSLFQADRISGGIVDLGGDILTYGRKPDHTSWKIAVRSPYTEDGTDDSLGILSAQNSFILTSGDYERYFESDGKRYQHIIDPFTCSPAETSLRSATVIFPLEHDNGITADAFATSLILMGCKKAIRFWKNSTTDFDMILAGTNGHIYVTEGIKQQFQPSGSSDHPYLFLSKKSGISR